SLRAPPLAARSWRPAARSGARSIARPRAPPIWRGASRSGTRRSAPGSPKRCCAKRARKDTARPAAAGSPRVSIARCEEPDSMSGLIQGLEIARRALLAHQAALNVTGHNIANVATEGYTRRSPVLVPMPPEQTPNGILGTGVRLEGVSRNRSFFLDTQLRKEASLAGRWESRSQVLQQIESLVAEPSDGGIGALLDGFFNAWLELSNQPEDAGTRAVVVQAGQ